MKGYTKPLIFDDTIVEENIWVGCRRCNTTWHEKMQLFKVSPRINGCSYLYDYCDNCITEEEKDKK